MKMNLPNKLTLTRLVLAPIFFLIFQVPTLAPSMGIVCAIVLVVLYVVMELTDLLDGKIARKRNLVTDLGKVMDPFADSLCHITFFACFVSVQIMPVWAFIIIIWREISISFLRMLMMAQGKAVAANMWGKAKTVLYAVCSICGIALFVCILLSPNAQWIQNAKTVLIVLFALADVASVLSFVIYGLAIKKSGALKSMTR